LWGTKKEKEKYRLLLQFSLCTFSFFVFLAKALIYALSSTAFDMSAGVHLVFFRIAIGEMGEISYAVM